MSYNPIRDSNNIPPNLRGDNAGVPPIPPIPPIPKPKARNVEPDNNFGFAQEQPQHNYSKPVPTPPPPPIPQPKQEQRVVEKKRVYREGDVLPEGYVVDKRTGIARKVIPGTVFSGADGDDKNYVINKPLSQQAVKAMLKAGFTPKLVLKDLDLDNLDEEADKYLAHLRGW